MAFCIVSLGIKDVIIRKCHANSTTTVNEWMTIGRADWTDTCMCVCECKLMRCCLYAVWLIACHAPLRARIEKNHLLLRRCNGLAVIRPKSWHKTQNCDADCIARSHWGLLIIRLRRDDGLAVICHKFDAKLCGWAMAAHEYLRQINQNQNSKNKW